ncbi:MAG: hypothetical protein RLZZ618_2660 [Pseudomonadota bacterium]|jgi:hypothetical protein
MKTVHHHKILAAATWLLPALASANGWVFHEPHRGVAAGWTASERLSLQSERLALELHPASYAARVVYTVTDRGAQTPGERTTMYFPVVCSQPDPPEKAAPCVRRFEATLNGSPLPSRRLMQAQPLPLKRLVSKLDRRLPKPREEAGNEARAWFVYRIDIPQGTRVQELAVSYRADYATIGGGTSKSAVQDHGVASLVYDFLPASAWAGKATTQLQIDIDSSRMKSPLSWRQKQWPFVQVSKDALRLVIDRPDFAALAPLQLETDNGNYHHFSDQVKTLTEGKVRYRASSLGAETKSAKTHGDLKALVDRNPATFWCWRGAQASFNLDFDATAILPEFDRFSQAYLNGLALLNGATTDLETARGQGTARKIELSIGTYRGVQTFKSATMKSDRDQFYGWVELELTDTGSTEAFDPAPAFTGEADSNLTAADRHRIPQLRRKVTVTGTRTGANDENCIAEILPLYNPG